MSRSALPPLPPLHPLAPGEAMAVWALRLVARHPGNAPVVAQELLLAYGPIHGEAAADALLDLAAVLRAAGRRRLVLESAESPFPTADERSLLLLIAASAARHWTLRDALLRWLILPTGRDAAAKAALGLAGALAGGGHRLGLTLPTPRAPRAPDPEGPLRAAT